MSENPESSPDRRRLLRELLGAGDNATGTKPGKTAVSTQSKATVVSRRDMLVSSAAAAVTANSITPTQAAIPAATSTISTAKAPIFDSFFASAFYTGDLGRDDSYTSGLLERVEYFDNAQRFVGLPPDSDNTPLKDISSMTISIVADAIKITKRLFTPVNQDHSGNHPEDSMPPACIYDVLEPVVKAYKALEKIPYPGLHNKRLSDAHKNALLELQKLMYTIFQEHGAIPPEHPFQPEDWEYFPIHMGMMEHNIIPFSRKIPLQKRADLSLNNMLQGLLKQSMECLTYKKTKTEALPTVHGEAGEKKIARWLCYLTQEIRGSCGLENFAPEFSKILEGSFEFPEQTFIRDEYKRLNKIVSGTPEKKAGRSFDEFTRAIEQQEMIKHTVVREDLLDQEFGKRHWTKKREGILPPRGGRE